MKTFFAGTVILLILAIAPLWPLEYKTFPYSRQGSTAYGLERLDPLRDRWMKFAWGADSPEEAEKWIKQQPQRVPCSLVLLGKLKLFPED